MYLNQEIKLNQYVYYKIDVPKPGDKIESVCILWFCFVLLDKHWKWTNMKVWQSDWKQLLWYATFPLTSDRAQLELISRWTIVYEYLFKKSTNQRALSFWCKNKNVWKALLRFYQLYFHWPIVSSSGHDL